MQESWLKQLLFITVVLSLLNKLPMRSFRVIISFVLFHFAGTAYSQKPDVQAYLKKYPQVPFVYLGQSDNVDISIRENKLSVITHHEEKLLILKNNFNTIHTKKVRTSTFGRILNLEA